MKNSYSSKYNFPKFTSNGFKVIKCPEPAWGIIKDAYSLLKDKEVEEKFVGKESIIRGEGTTSNILNFDIIPNIKNLIHHQLLDTHKEWCNTNIEPSLVYGIRSYKKGAILASHVDRIKTHHIASIIMVDKDLDGGSDWALEIQDHQGNWNKIYSQPGDMILYESAVCEHSRKHPFQGKFYNNFYLHYKLSDWTYSVKQSTSNAGGKLI